MSEKRRGLGRGIGALIPPAPPTQGAVPGGRDRPVDVFFPAGPGGRPIVVPRETSHAADTQLTDDGERRSPGAGFFGPPPCFTWNTRLWETCAKPLLPQGNPLIPIG